MQTSSKLLSFFTAEIVRKALLLLDLEHPVW